MLSQPSNKTTGDNGGISKIRINNSIVPTFGVKLDHTLYLRSPTNE